MLNELSLVDVFYLSVACFLNKKRKVMNGRIEITSRRVTVQSLVESEAGRKKIQNRQRVVSALYEGSL